MTAARAYNASVGGNRSRRLVKKLLKRADGRPSFDTYWVTADGGRRIVTATEAWDTGLQREWCRAAGIPDMYALLAV